VTPERKPATGDEEYEDEGGADEVQEDAAGDRSGSVSGAGPSSGHRLHQASRTKTLQLKLGRAALAPADNGSVLLSSVDLPNTRECVRAHASREGGMELPKDCRHASEKK